MQDNALRNKCVNNICDRGDTFCDIYCGTFVTPLSKTEPNIALQKAVVGANLDLLVLNTL